METKSVKLAMDSIDAFHIRESFDALDDTKLGFLSLDQFYILYLGLGYPKQTIQEIESEVTAIQSDQNVTIETVLRILSKKSRNNQSEIKKLYKLVDQDAKGYIDAQDLVRLSRTEIGQEISIDEAEAMMEQSQLSKGDGTKLIEGDFRKLLAPPSP